MNQTRFLSMVFLLIAGAAFQCRPHVTKPTTLTGKLVINEPCGHYVIQVLSKDIDPRLVTASWKDSIGDILYTNVFTVSNACDFEGRTLATNDNFSFRINDTVIVQNCMLCDIFYPTPPTRNVVTHVQRVN